MEAGGSVGAGHAVASYADGHKPLLGIVKHALNTEVIYFGPTFGREWPRPE